MDSEITKIFSYKWHNKNSVSYPIGQESLANIESTILPSAEFPKLGKYTGILSRHENKRKNGTKINNTNSIHPTKSTCVIPNSAVRLDCLAEWDKVWYQRSCHRSKRILAPWTKGPKLRRQGDKFRLRQWKTYPVQRFIFILLSPVQFDT